MGWWQEKSHFFMMTWEHYYPHNKTSTQKKKRSQNLCLKTSNTQINRMGTVVALEAVPFCKLHKLPPQWCLLKHYYRSFDTWTTPLFSHLAKDNEHAEIQQHSNKIKRRIIMLHCLYHLHNSDWAMSKFCLWRKNRNLPQSHNKHKTQTH